MIVIVECKHQAMSDDQPPRPAGRRHWAAWMALKMVPGIGNVLGVGLVRAFRSAEAVFEARDQDLQIAGVRREVRRYHAQPGDCEECPLRTLCVTGKGARQIRRDQFAGHHEQHTARMKTPEAKVLYNRRRHPGERPFAMIKGMFGLRQFLLRGVDRVRNEWRWAALAFNIQASYESDGEREDVMDGIEDLDVGLVFGGGVELRRITIEGRYTFGLRSAFRDGDLDGAFKNRTLSLLVGFRFRR